MSRSLRRKQQKVARNRTGKSPDAALARADQALQAKQWDKASGALRDVLKVRPDHVDSWINLGALHIKAGEAQQADSFWEGQRTGGRSGHCCAGCGRAGGDDIG